MGLEFAKYHKVTKFKEMAEEFGLEGYKDDYIKEVYICRDTHVFWIVRIIEGYNSDWEPVDEGYLVEREQVDFPDFIDYINEHKGRNFKYSNRRDLDMIIDAIGKSTTAKMLLSFSNNDAGMEGYDYIEVETLQTAIDSLDGGFGIVEI